MLSILFFYFLFFSFFFLCLYLSLLNLYSVIISTKIPDSWKLFNIFYLMQSRRILFLVFPPLIFSPFRSSQLFHSLFHGIVHFRLIASLGPSIKPTHELVKILAIRQIILFLWWSVIYIISSNFLSFQQESYCSCWNLGIFELSFLYKFLT